MKQRINKMSPTSKQVNLLLTDPSDQTISVAVEHKNNFLSFKKPSFDAIPQISSQVIVVDDDTTIEEHDDIRNYFSELKSAIINGIDSSDSTVEKEIAECQNKLQLTLEKFQQYDNTLGKEALQVIWESRVFFSELIDMIDNYNSSMKNEIKPEFLSLSTAINMIRVLKLVDPILYKQCGIGNTFESIASFFASRETKEFSFLHRYPLIEMNWIRNGWFWDDDDGDEDMVIKIMQKYCLPIFYEILEHEKFDCEDDFLIALAHCQEILDFCIHPKTCSVKLFNLLQAKLDLSYKNGILNVVQFKTLQNEIMACIE